jgi:5-hydroxyisourate hydrolase-like protein (transthyretin family)
MDDIILNDGQIAVTSILECGENEYLEGIKINLYKINGLSPVLIKSMTTDKNGQVVFSGIEDGCYRIIEIIDKKYFEKPKYINWNEIIIDSINKNQKVIVVNKIKSSASQNEHKC